MIFTSNGLKRIKANSFWKHFSFSYNLRYNFMFTWTFDGYRFFSTCALCLYLLQGPPEQVLLGLVILPLEALPQFLGNFIFWLYVQTLALKCVF